MAAAGQASGPTRAVPVIRGHGHREFSVAVVALNTVL